MSMQAMARWLSGAKKVTPLLALLAATLVAVVMLGVVASAASAATFSNNSVITINDGGQCIVGQAGKATPYPSVIAVDGLAGSVTDVNVTIHGLSHSWPDDIGLLLVSPAGQSTILMADSGGGAAVSGITLVFDDAAPGGLPDHGQIVSGTYKPSDGSTPFQQGCSVPHSFPTDATGTNPPAGPYGLSLSVFKNTNPNGNWQLYVIDDSGAFSGSITGWSLDISATTADTTPPTVTDTSLTATTPQGDASKTTNVAATFSEEVQNVTSSTFILERRISVKKNAPPKFERVAATVTPSEDGLSAVLDPTLDLPKGDYRATITTDVTDMADPANALEDPEVWTFKVAK